MILAWCGAGDEGGAGAHHHPEISGRSKRLTHGLRWCASQSTLLADVASLVTQLSQAEANHDSKAVKKCTEQLSMIPVSVVKGGVHLKGV